MSETNETQVIPSQAELALKTAQETTMAQQVHDALLDLPVRTPAEIATASELLVDVKGRAKVLDDRMREITRPLNEALKSTRELFKPALRFYEDAEAVLKRKIADAHLAIAAANRAAMEAAQQQLAQGDVRGAALATSVVVEAPQADGVRTREIFGYRVVNALEVPREFLSVDDAKVKEHIRAHGKDKPIPGIVIEADVQIIAARGR